MTPDNSTRSAVVEEDQLLCWICLEAESEQLGKLETPCACQTRHAHLKCLARWQLQQAGKREERYCRFCANELPDWKSTLTPQHLRPADPVMVVTLGDAVHRIRVKPGEDGMREFQQEIRRLFDIPEEVDFEVTFRCRAPLTADTIQLDGMSSFEAATHCASLMAAQRLAHSRAAGTSGDGIQQQRYDHPQQQHQQHQQPHGPEEGQGESTHIPTTVEAAAAAAAAAWQQHLAAQAQQYQQQLLQMQQQHYQMDLLQQYCLQQQYSQQYSQRTLQHQDSVSSSASSSFSFPVDQQQQHWQQQQLAMLYAQAAAPHHQHMTGVLPVQTQQPQMMYSAADAAAPQDPYAGHAL